MLNSNNPKAGPLNSNLGSNPETNDLDQFLDAALTTYTPSESRPGLPERTMAQINSALARPAVSTPIASARLWKPAFAVVTSLVSAAALLFLFVHDQPKSHLQVPRASSAASNPSIPSSSMPSAPHMLQTVQTDPPRQPRHHVVSDPTPVASSSAPIHRPADPEILLARFVIQHPEEGQAAEKLRVNLDRPIATEPVKIQQIRTDPIIIRPIEMDPKSPTTF